MTSLCCNCLEYSAVIQCSHCKIATYCGNTCRSAAWKSAHRYECNILAGCLSSDTDLNSTQQRYRSMVQEYVGMMNGSGGTKRPVDPDAPAPAHAKLRLPVITETRLLSTVQSSSSATSLASAHILQESAVTSSSSDTGPRVRVMKIITPPQSLLLDVRSLTTNIKLESAVVLVRLPEMPKGPLFPSVKPTPTAATSSSSSIFTTQLPLIPFDTLNILSVSQRLGANVRVFQDDLASIVTLKMSLRKDAVKLNWPTATESDYTGEMAWAMLSKKKKTEVQKEIVDTKVALLIISTKKNIHKHRTLAVEYYEFMKERCARIGNLTVNIKEPEQGMTDTSFRTKLLNKPLDSLIGGDDDTINTWIEQLNRARAQGSRLNEADKDFIEVFVKFLLEQAHEFYWMLYLFHVYSRLNSIAGKLKNTFTDNMRELYYIQRKNIIKIPSLANCSRDIMNKN